MQSEHIRRSARERAERYHAQTWNMGEFQYVVGALGEVCRDLLAALDERDAAVARAARHEEALRRIAEPSMKPWPQLADERRAIAVDALRDAKEPRCVPLCGASKAYGRMDRPWKHEQLCPVRIAWEAERRAVGEAEEPQ